MLVSFGKPGDERRRDTFDFKTTDRVFNLIAERPETLAEFVPVEIRGELLRPIHALHFKRLPSGFGRIKRCVEHDAMGVEMGIEFPARIMPERRSEAKVPKNALRSSKLGQAAARLTARACRLQLHPWALRQAASGDTPVL